jgi:hypothetical protein
MAAMLFTLRISLPDRPGTLGSVATAFGKGGANILTLDVVDSGADVAVDDLLVEAPEGMQKAIQIATEMVPGLVVEELRPLEAFQDFMSPLELAAALSEARHQRCVLNTLVERLPEAMRSDWCVILSAGEPEVNVLASSLGAPSLSGVSSTWLPLDGAKRLPPAPWMPPSWTEGPASRDGQGKFELAAVPVFEGSTVALIGRRKGPQYRNSELVEFGLISRIATSSQAAFQLGSAP